MKMKTTSKLLILLLLTSLGISACKLLQGAAFEAQGIPSDFDGLELWLRADRGAYKDWDCSDEAFEGDPVTCWQDYSDNGNDAKAMVDSPHFMESSGELDGMPAIHFEYDPGTPQALSSVKPLHLLGTKFVVASSLAGATNYFITNSATNVYVASTSFFFQVQNIADIILDDYFPASQAAILVFNVGLSTSSFYIRGKHIGTISEGVDPLQADSFYFGGQQTADAEAYNTNIAEIIVFNRVLKDIERMQIEKYLSDKYDIGVSK